MSEDNEDGVKHKGGGGKDKPPRPVVVALPSKREVAAIDLANLAASGLTDETIKLAKLYTEHHHQRIAELMQRRGWSRSQFSALVIPFFLPEQPDDAQPFAYRVRPAVPRVERRGGNGKERVVKYDQASSAGLLVYFPPRSRTRGAYRDAAEPLLWTEGEKKALLLDQLGFATVGLTGVWNWIDSAHSDTTREHRLHPHIMQHVVAAGREHVIVYDGDARKNDQVMKAAQRLAGVLIAAGATSVRFVCPPDDPGAKGIDDYHCKHGEAATRALLETASPLEAIAPNAPLQRLRSLQALRDAPLDSALLLPDGYELQRDGSLWECARSARKGDTKVTHTPMFIARALADYQTGDERVELSYARGERWVTQIVSRKAAYDARTLVAEAVPYGAPVSSNTASKIVDWLDAFADANVNTIPRIACVSTGGWHRYEGVRFFAAREPIAPEDTKVVIAIDSRGDRRKILASLEARGELDAHVAALKRAWDADSTCAVMICAAFAATLLEPLRAANFAVHLVGESSRGKTSMLKIAASTFGNPGDPHWLASWNVSPAGAELRAVVLCDLPQCYDEVGGGDPQAVERMVYSLINGGGKTRAQRDMSMRETSSWRTIVLSTGERELADEGTATGAQVRVVQLHVSGFGELTAGEVDALRDECAANAGRAGEEWLRYLVEYEPDDWKALQGKLRDGIALLRKDTSDPLQGRIASYFGLLGLAESLLASAFGIGDSTGKTMQLAFKNASGTRELVQGVGERARELVEDWVVSEPDAFPEITPSGDGFDVKSKGKTRHGFVRPDGMVFLIRAEFTAFCTRHRLTAREVLREWRRLGWLQVDAGRGFDKMVRLPGGLQRFYALFPLDSVQSFTGEP